MTTRWPLIGRRVELDRIDRALADPATEGVVVFGPAGVGRSRLAEEARHLAERRGRRVPARRGERQRRGDAARRPRPPAARRPAGPDIGVPPPRRSTSVPPSGGCGPRSPPRPTAGPSPSSSTTCTCSTPPPPRSWRSWSPRGPRSSSGPSAPATRCPTGSGPWPGPTAWSRSTWPRYPRVRRHAAAPGPRRAARRGRGRPAVGRQRGQRPVPPRARRRGPRERRAGRRGRRLVARRPRCSAPACCASWSRPGSPPCRPPAAAAWRRSPSAPGWPHATSWRWPAPRRSWTWRGGA